MTVELVERADVERSKPESVTGPARPGRRGRRISRFLARHRRPLFVAHKWLSIVMLLWVLLECVSGSALVLRSDIDRWTHSGAFHATEGDVGIDSAVDVALATHERSVLNSVEVPTADHTGGMYIVGLYDGDGEYKRVIVDPGSGEVTDDDFRSVWLVQELADLHFNLNSSSVFGLTGIEAQAWLGVVFLVVLLTGFYVWYWPRMRAWRKVLHLRRHLGRYRWHLDLHNAVGLVTIIPMLLITITGIRFAFPSQVNAVYDFMTFGRYDDQPEALVTSEPSAGRPPIGLDAARAVAEELGVVDIEVVLSTQGSPVNTYEVVGTIDGALLGMIGGERTIGIHIDQYSGSIVEVHDPADTSAVQRGLDEWANPVHFGSFAGRGGQVLWVVVGLGPAVLVVTGVVMWINRHNVRKKRAEEMT